MRNVVNSVSEVDYDKHFKFNEDVVFGSVSYGGCRCLEKFFSSYKKNKAEKEGFYILGLSNDDVAGYSPIVDIDNDTGLKERIFVIGQYKNGVMRDVITNKVINYVDDVDVINFCAPRSFYRYSNSTWMVFPEIDGQEFEPRYYFSDLCYVSCNEVSKFDVLCYLEYFMFCPEKTFTKYYNRLKELQNKLKDDYYKITDAYMNEIAKRNIVVDNGLRVKRKD